ncbi:transcription factor SAC51-like [Cornus florida]|uniref:transcription factor SAC51-like n=1 Tax=Cornus florida TaxID=4283 RepID=UPI0028965DC4|nr:transcription factor SAC51-like [Cornus florida]
MVKDSDSWLHQPQSAWNLPNLKYMSTTLQSRQQNGFPSCMGPDMYSATMAPPGVAAPGLPALKTIQTKGAQGFLHCLPPHLESLLFTPHSYLEEKHSASYGVGIKAMPNAVSGCNQKRFLIFDQSGDQTRMFLTPPSGPVPNPVFTPIKPTHFSELRDQKQAANVEEIPLVKSIIQEKSYENHVLDGSELHEDTEEINALLYSDDDDNDGSDDDDDDEDDEVTSTGHFPLEIKGIYEKHEYVGEIIEEVASSDGPTKRQRLLDGGYNKSLFINVASSSKQDRPRRDGNNTETSRVKGRTQDKDTGSTLGNEQSRKVKISETLRALKSIVPGIKSEDPLLIIDEAIISLKCLKNKAKTLGF